MRQQITYTWEVKDLVPGLKVWIKSGITSHRHLLVRKTSCNDPRFVTEAEAGEWARNYIQSGHRVLNLACLFDGSLSHGPWTDAEEMAGYLTAMNASPSP